METVDAAEKEASEVLHTLLSVERVEKQNHDLDQQQQVVVVTSKIGENSIETISNSTSVENDQGEAGLVHWHTPALFTDIHEVTPQFTTLTGEPVVWQGHTVQVDRTQHPVPPPQQPAAIESQPEPVLTIESSKKISRPGNKQKDSPKKRNKLTVTHSSGVLPTQLEENAQEVRERFEKGCECQEDNCFKGLSPEYVYRHRLNIAELTKAEHDMYLMGVTMAVLTNPEETVRHKERRRLRAQYVFQGRRVCLDAFLYLENCTHYQLKRIRKHVMTHGVAPRIHGNHGKKPHNTFSLDIYRHATSFLRHFILRNSPGSSSNQSTNSQQTNVNNSKTKSKFAGKTPPLYLPADITRKTIHNAYREYCQHFEPSIKVMGYSTFRHFMKEQFPHVKFCKVESSGNKPASAAQQTQATAGSQAPIEVEIVNQQNAEVPNVDDTRPDSQSATIITSSGAVQQLTAIPVVVEEEAHRQQTAFIVTPVSNVNTNTYTSYHLTSASYQQLTHASVVTVPSTASNTYGFTTL